MRLMNTPRSVEISITNRCNLRCTYCSHFTSAGDVDQDLPTHEWLTFFEELGRCAVMGVTLEGGEPFCREDLRELIRTTCPKSNAIQYPEQWNVDHR